MRYRTGGTVASNCTLARSAFEIGRDNPPLSSPSWSSACCAEVRKVPGIETLSVRHAERGSFADQVVPFCCGAWSLHGPLPPSPPLGRNGSSRRVSCRALLVGPILPLSEAGRPSLRCVAMAEMTFAEVICIQQLHYTRRNFDLFSAALSTTARLPTPSCEAKAPWREPTVKLQ